MESSKFLGDLLDFKLSLPIVLILRIKNRKTMLVLIDELQSRWIKGLEWEHVIKKIENYCVIGIVSETCNYWN